MTKKEAQILRSQKNNLQMMIFKSIKLKQDAKPLIIEYHKIVDKLVKNGYKVFIRSEYLKLDYWGLMPADIYTKRIANKTHINKSISNNNYILNLVWNEDESIKNYINKLKNYVIGIGLEKIEEDFNDDSIKTEYIIKYKYTGTEESFKLLKRSLNEIINVFCEDNHNIGIYGSKQIIT